MAKKKSLIGVLIVLALLALQVNAAYAAPASQGTTIDGTVQSITQPTAARSWACTLSSSVFALITKHHNYLKLLLQYSYHSFRRLILLCPVIKYSVYDQELQRVIP